MQQERSSLTEPWSPQRFYSLAREVTELATAICHDSWERAPNYTRNYSDGLSHDWPVPRSYYDFYDAVDFAMIALGVEDAWRPALSVWVRGHDYYGQEAPEVC